VAVSCELACVSLNTLHTADVPLCETWRHWIGLQRLRICSHVCEGLFCPYGSYGPTNSQRAVPRFFQTGQLDSVCVCVWGGGVGNGRGAMRHMLWCSISDSVASAPQMQQGKPD
jgi:hypothetical protein